MIYIKIDVNSQKKGDGMKLLRYSFVSLAIIFGFITIIASNGGGDSVFRQ